VRKWLRSRIPFARNIALRDWPFLDRPYGFSCGAIEYVKVSLFRGLGDRFDRAAVHGDIGQNRSAWNVHVPQAMVDKLIMPSALPCFEIQRHQALTEEVISRTVRTEVISRRQFHGKIDQTKLFVDGNLAPDPGVPCIGPRIVQPRLDPKLAGLGY